MDNEVLRNIKSRRSIRKYEKRQITAEELHTVLEAGTYAPTGMGNQSPFIVAVQDEAVKAQLVRMNAEVMGTTSNPYYDAPTIVLVFGPTVETWKNTVQDGSLVLGTMMLAAKSIGLGTCWINREMEMFATEEGKALMKRFGLPDGLMGIGAISLGYPAAETKMKQRKEDYFRIV